jgi:hypothetical protein
VPGNRVDAYRSIKEAKKDRVSTELRAQIKIIGNRFPALLVDILAVIILVPMVGMSQIRCVMYVHSGNETS